MADDSATVKSYLDHWNECFHHEGSEDNMVQHLQKLAFLGELRGCNFRSVCWRVFLECFTHDPAQWQDNAVQSRKNYVDIKSKHIFDPKDEFEKKDISVENPLSQDDQSRWNKYFRNQELRKTIERDVSRTCPEMKFFQDESVHKLLSDVLFCYACEHSDLSYRQGMHELLAPLVFIIHCDLEAAGYAKESGQLTELIEVILDGKYLEHDAYQMFCRLMESTDKWYSVVVDESTSPQPSEHDSQMNSVELEKPFQEKSVAATGTLEIAKKLCHIWDTLLAKHDKQLHVYLTDLEIIPQVFGLEFSLQDLLVLWDALFADGPNLDLVDYLFVAMMIHIRGQLLNSDYTTCLQIFMKYPAVDDINDIVHAAKCIRDGIPLSPQTLSFNPDTGKTPASPSKNNKENSLLKAFKDIRRIVLPEKRPAPVRRQEPANPAQVVGNNGAMRQNPIHASPFGNPVTHQPTRSEERPRRKSSEERMGKVMESIRGGVDLHAHSVKITPTDAQKLKQMTVMCNFCSDKLDACITALQVRDILKGTINFDLIVTDDVINSAAKT